MTCSEIKYPEYSEDIMVTDEDKDEDEDENSAEQQPKKETPAEKAESFPCSNPHFIVIMCESYLGSNARMWIPKDHGLDYLNDPIKQEAEQRIGRKRWTVASLRGKDSFLFGKGWKEFALSNHFNT